MTLAYKRHINNSIDILTETLKMNSNNYPVFKTLKEIYKGKNLNDEIHKLSKKYPNLVERLM